MSWKSFFKGMASCFDLFGVFGSTSDLPKTDEEAFQRDRDALSRDRNAVLRDMLAAIREPQLDGYVMSEAEYAALRDPARRPYPLSGPGRCPAGSVDLRQVNRPSAAAKECLKEDR